MNKDKNIHLNFLVSMKMLSDLDTLRVSFLKSGSKLPNRSEIIRILLSEALKARLEDS